MMRVDSPRTDDTDAELDRLLSGLNEPQREAVLHGEGPLLILAGAGSGKTRVLTHRIAYLLATGQARPTRSSRSRSRTRPRRRCASASSCSSGARTRAMWVMTFHAACARMLRADAHRLGYTRQFTIYDQADARRLVKRCLDELDVDPKRFTPAAIQPQISDAKNKLRDAEDYGELVGSFFEQTVADVYELYERELHRMNAMDFDDLLVRAVNVLELFPEVRERYATRLPPRARRRVPGHQPRAVPLAAAARAASTATSRWSATTTSRSTASAAPTSATSSTSRTTSRTRTSSSWSRTTARRRRSSTPPTR